MASDSSRWCNGDHGQPTEELKATEQVLLRNAQLVEVIPKISELDLNPIFALPPGQGCRIVDARIQLRPL